MRKCFLEDCIGLLSCSELLPSLHFNRQPWTVTLTRHEEDWDIPGLAIAVVKDGKVVVMKGYGVRDHGTKEPVDENTLFMIASQ